MIKFGVKPEEMNIQTISIDFPNDILLALNESENDFKKRIKMTLAIQLYQLQKLTIGKAAQLSGLSRLEFENELSKNKIPISNLIEKDILNDIETLSLEEITKEVEIMRKSRYEK